MRNVILIRMDWRFLVTVKHMFGFEYFVKLMVML